MVHREVFKHDGLEGINQCSGFLMMEVSPLIANRLMSTAHKLGATFAAMALVPPFREPLLLFLEPAMRPAYEAGIVHHITIRVSHEVLEPNTVNLRPDVGEKGQESSKFGIMGEGQQRRNFPMYRLRQLD